MQVQQAGVSTGVWLTPETLFILLMVSSWKSSLDGKIELSAKNLFVDSADDPSNRRESVIMIAVSVHGAMPCEGCVDFTIVAIFAKPFSFSPFAMIRMLSWGTPQSSAHMQSSSTCEQVESSM